MQKLVQPTISHKNVKLMRKQCLFGVRNTKKSMCFSTEKIFHWFWARAGARLCRELSAPMQAVPKRIPTDQIKIFGFLWLLCHHNQEQHKRENCTPKKLAQNRQRCVSKQTKKETFLVSISTTTGGACIVKQTLFFQKFKSPLRRLSWPNNAIRVSMSRHRNLLRPVFWKRSNTINNQKKQN